MIVYIWISACAALIVAVWGAVWMSLAPGRRNTANVLLFTVMAAVAAYCWTWILFAGFVAAMAHFVAWLRDKPVTPKVQRNERSLDIHG